jgi:hypothetical protein
MYGEGHNDIGHKDLVSTMTSKDFRDRPAPSQKEASHIAESGEDTRITKIATVEMLAHDGELIRENHGDGPQITFPKEKPCDYAYTFKITFKK